jgi:hypothetical protein
MLLNERNIELVRAPLSSSYPRHLSDLILISNFTAIVGSGIGGSSAAYFLQKEFEGNEEGIEVTVFEKDKRVCGRVNDIVIPVNGDENDEKRYRMELGASIFHVQNRFISNAIKEFGLKTKNQQKEEESTKENQERSLFNWVVKLFGYGEGESLSYLSLSFFFLSKNSFF